MHLIAQQNTFVLCQQGDLEQHTFFGPDSGKLTISTVLLARQSVSCLNINISSNKIILKQIRKRGDEKCMRETNL